MLKPTFFKFFFSHPLVTSQSRLRALGNTNAMDHPAPPEPTVLLLHLPWNFDRMAITNHKSQILKGDILTMIQEDLRSALAEELNSLKGELQTLSRAA